MSREIYTVGYLRDVLTYCEDNAVIHVALMINGKTKYFPVSTLLIHQGNDGREVLGFGCQENLGDIQ